jgi:hypothetical protein
MSLKPRIVAALLRLYPLPWRSEYGPELTAILVACPLTARIIGDVVWSGLGQRVRAAEPATLLGLGAMLVILTGLAWNIIAPPLSGRGLAVLLEESSKTLPTVIVKPLTSDLCVLFLVGCGCWTNLRFHGRLSQSGVAAMRLCGIAGTPIVIAGILMLLGVLHVVVVAPGDAPTPFLQHGFTYTYYNAHHRLPSPSAVLVAPLFRLPEAWIWGLLGGRLGRGISRPRRSQTAGL